MTAGSGRLVDVAIGHLRDQGERVTKARRALVTVLAESDAHLSADDLADRLAELEPGTHRATVYRTLESLERVGVVSHVHLPHGPTTYHLVDEDHTHLHLLCRSCGQIVDAPHDLLDDVVQRLEASAGFRIDPDHVALTGWCRGCRPDRGE